MTPEEKKLLVFLTGTENPIFLSEREPVMIKKFLEYSAELQTKIETLSRDCEQLEKEKESVKQDAITTIKEMDERFMEVQRGSVERDVVIQHLEQENKSILDALTNIWDLAKCGYYHNYPHETNQELLLKLNYAKAIINTTQK